jgi:phage putative tail component domain protein
LAFIIPSSTGKVKYGYNMEDAEERKKMKKIEKEEQLKKKLEQTMEEKMAADSKTVEGESAVGKAEEGNTAAEQEPEDAPALSEEELNAMYERFQQRLQKEGLADADGKPTEKTLEIRRQIVEKKVEREKQAERQKQIAKRAKTTKHWVRTAKAAGVVLVVGACVFGASMTSEANRIRLVETISGVRNTGDTTWVDNGEERKYTEGSLDEAQKEIRDTIHIAVPEFYYVPKGMQYDNVIVSEVTQMAIIRYQYNNHFVYFHLAANEKDLSQGSWKDRKQIKVETLDEEIDVEMGNLLENNEECYYAAWKYKDAYYQIGGNIEKEEIIKILNEMQYNM